MVKGANRHYRMHNRLWPARPETHPQITQQPWRSRKRRVIPDGHRPGYPGHATLSKAGLRRLRQHEGPPLLCGRPGVSWPPPLFCCRALQARYDVSMPRMARIAIPDVPHHVTQPANKAGGQAAATAARMFSSATRTGGAVSSRFQETPKPLRLRTRTGRPPGDAAFVPRLEELSGRFLAPRKGGRPKKARKDGEARKHG